MGEQPRTGRVGRAWTRRGVVRAAALVGVGAAATGAAGYRGYRRLAESAAAAKPPAAGHQVMRFVSRPDLRPPAVTVTRDERHFTGAAGERLIFMAPKNYRTRNGPGQRGLMVLDTSGRLVWFRRTGATPMNFQRQTYRGRPVLTWWEGDVPDGYGKGHGVIADTAYRRIATVRAGHGLEADLHEFRLTGRGTALITAYRTAAADLSSIGGPADGTVYSGVVQEIDVESGAVVFAWDSLDHVDVTESHRERPDDRGTSAHPYDYFHINAICEHPDGDLLVSARNTWAIYKLSRKDGRIVWRLGGQRSDFTHDQRTRFYWQHDVVAHDDGRISVFDNGAWPQIEKESRGLMLRADTETRKVSLVRAYTHPDEVLAGTQGSCRTVDGDRVFVGWGDRPNFSEFTANGRLILDGRFPDNVQSYRAFTGSWTGRPSGRPAVAARRDGNRTRVFASWNGSTEVRQWRVLAGATKKRLRAVTVAARTDFETAVTVAGGGPYFAVEALDARGAPLARSETVTVAGS